MKFEKYSAIYRNSDITITDDSVIGTVEDVKEYFRYELARQCMSTEINYENLCDNMDMIRDLFINLENDDENNKIKVKYHPMGALVIEEVVNE